MKKLHNLPVLLAAAFLLSACGGDDGDNEGKTSSSDMPKAAAPTITYVSEYEDTSAPGEDMISFKLCKVNQPGYHDTLMFLYNNDKKQIKYDAKKETEAKQAGKAFNNTWSLVRSAELVGVCPAGAGGRCEVSNFITSYYTQSPKALARFKKNCAGLPKNVWTDNP